MLWQPAWYYPLLQEVHFILSVSLSCLRYISECFQRIDTVGLPRTRFISDTVTECAISSEAGFTGEVKSSREIIPPREVKHPREIEPMIRPTASIPARPASKKSEYQRERARLRFTVPSAAGNLSREHNCISCG